MKITYCKISHTIHIHKNVPHIGHEGDYVEVRLIPDRLKYPYWAMATGKIGRYHVKFKLEK